ncbi:MAG TPA: DUF2142 domain-containing protein, partial [Acidimicrobiales bacterium]|nr:DUF2142 domain-containing protein [Acidimicrobiales bacterium]
LGFEGLPTFWDLVRSPAEVPAHSTPKCFTKGAGAVPASCARSLNRPLTAYDIKGGYDKYSQSYQARYPPLYYEVVGLPSLFPGSTIDIYLMRLVSAAFSAVFFAFALVAAAVYSRNRFVIVGLLVAATPMAFFLAGVINPSGLEVAAAIAVWTSGAVLVTERLAHPPAGLVAIFGTSAAFLESVRPLSPLWLVLIVIVLLLCAERHALAAACSSRSLRVAAAAVAFFGALAIWWIAAVHSTDLYVAGNQPVPSTVSAATIFRVALAHNAFYIPDMIGVFGWFDTYSPLFTFVVWYALIVLMVIGAAVRSLRNAFVLALVLLTVLVLPAIIVTSHAHANGYTWSGRDMLPIAVGLPILAGALFSRGVDRYRLASIARSSTPLVIAFAAVAQFVAFFEALRRYAVGSRGPVFGFIVHPSWRPAVGIVGALALEVLALGALSALFAWSIRRSDHDDVEHPARDELLGPSRGDDASSVSAATSVEGA